MAHPGTETSKSRATTSIRMPPGPGATGVTSPYTAARYALKYLLAGESAGDEVIAKYGDVFTVRIPGLASAVVVSDPTLIKQVFTAPSSALLGGKGVSPSATIYGAGSMFVQEEPEHLRRRKLLMSGFTSKTVAGYQDTIAMVADNALDRWPLGTEFSMLDSARELTLEVIMRVVFGVTDPAELLRLRTCLERLLAYGISEQIVFRYLTRSIGTVKHWRGLNRATANVHEALQGLLAQRRTEAHHARSDILSLLMSATTTDGHHLSDQEICDDLVTLLLAGHETTATTMAWIFDFLTRHPEVAARVVAEANTANESAYTDAVINETLRIRPVVVGTARVTAGTFGLGDWVLPSGTWIIAYIRGVNHNAATYPDPFEFRPERFLGTSPNNFAWIPFGGGAKRCLGAAFSQAELRTVLHTLLRRGEFEAAGAKPDTMVRRGPVLLPRNGVTIKLTKRSPRQHAMESRGA